MTITPVACRYLLGDPHRKPGPLARRVEAAIAWVADRYAALLRAVLPFRVVLMLAAVLLIGMSGWFATLLPSTFFPEIDESMERIYVKLAPGTSLSQASQRIREMGETLRRELPEGTVSLVLTNVGSPQNARAAMNSPNAGPHMGFIRLELVRCGTSRTFPARAGRPCPRNLEPVAILAWTFYSGLADWSQACSRTAIWRRL
jgi:multidrug efflux pump subunit AcrB